MLTSVTRLRPVSQGGDRPAGPQSGPGGARCSAMVIIPNRLSAPREKGRKSGESPTAAPGHRGRCIFGADVIAKVSLIDRRVSWHSIARHSPINKRIDVAFSPTWAACVFPRGLRRPCATKRVKVTKGVLSFVADWFPAGSAPGATRSSPGEAPHWQGPGPARYTWRWPARSPESRTQMALAPVGSFQPGPSPI